MKCLIYWTADLKSSKRWSSQLWTQFKQLRIEAWVQTPLKSWLFQAFIRNCLNCIHNCDDHSLLDLFIYFNGASTICSVTFNNKGCDFPNVEFQVRFSLQLPSMLLKRGEIQDTKTLNLSRNIVSLQVCVDVFCFSLRDQLVPQKKTFVLGRRNVLRKVERWPTLSNKFWLCCSSFIELTTCHATNAAILDLHQANQPISSLHFFNPQQILLLRYRLITQGEKRETSTQNLQRNYVAWQVEGFWISYFAPLTNDDENGNDNATNQWYDWLNKEK